MSDIEKKNHITVITVVYNDVNGLKKTIESVINQSYHLIEYLIIDGGSTDGTIETIKNYDKNISKWLSEPDKGIYDAMNKGIDMATGDWVIFMNAGDWFYNNDVIGNIFKKLHKDTQLIYGNHEVVYDTYIKVKKAKPESELWKGMICSHQSLFVKAELLKENKFNYLSYSIVADYHFMFNSWISNLKFQYVNTRVACYQSGGISENKLITTRWQTRSVVLEKINNFKTQFHFFKLLLATYLTYYAKSILSPNFFEYLAKIKNKITKKGE